MSPSPRKDEAAHAMALSDPGDTAFRLVTTERFAERLSAAGLHQATGFRRAVAQAPLKPGGRGPHALLEDPKGQGAAIRIRPYLRGGILGGLARDAFLSPDRALEEFSIWQTLSQRGAPLAEAVFASAEKRGGFWRLHLATLERPAAQDGLAWFENPEHRTRPAQSLRACAESIRRFHDAGALHGDLNLRNVLFELDPATAEPRCLLIDLAQARLRPALTARERMTDLMRLLRSVEKNQLDFPRRDRALSRFLSAYCGTDRGLRQRLLRSSAREQRRLSRHRFGWRLSRGLLPMGLAAFLACGDAPLEVSPDHATSPISWSILATGDTGRTGRFALTDPLFEGQRSVAKAMTQEAQRNPVDGLLLLGDNFYWRGLDHEHLIERIRRNLVTPYCYFLDLGGPRSNEIDSACPGPASERRPVPVYAVLGNHDLETPESPALQRKSVPDFLPGWTMNPNIAEVYEVAPGVSLILFESEISIRDPKTSRRALLDAITRAQGPWRIVATHRPIATDDEGGIPVGGYPVAVQRTLAEAAKAGRPVQLVLSAHHHNLQAFALDAPARLLQIGLGAGARAEGPLAHPEHPAARFGALSLGFARISLIGEGEHERLSVSLRSAPRWPWLHLFQSSSELARFEVDLDGNPVQRSGSRPAN